MKFDILAIDGDILAFRAAAAVQNVHINSFGYAQPFAHVNEGKVALDNMIYWLKENIPADNVEVFLTDGENFRKEIDPLYKANRKESVRPLLLDTLKEYLRESHAAYSEAKLEADDILSQAATMPDTKVCVVGKDKDYNTIPGFYHKIGDRDYNGKPIIKETAKWEAQRFHLMQTLAGDRVDGYFGCPGIGMERAARILDESLELFPEEGVITRGKNKGQKTTKWVGKPTDDIWRVVVSNYEKAGLGEEDALRNARLAYLLQNGEGPDYRWTPEKIGRAHV